MTGISQKQMNQFIRYIPQLEPQEFVGLAKLLGVVVVEDDEDKTPREFADVLEDVLEAFTKLNRKRRREFMTLLKQVTKQNMKDRTSSAADPQETVIEENLDAAADDVNIEEDVDGSEN